MGRLDIIIGSMFSGKSTEIIRLINRYKVLNKNILILNHCLDNRYQESSISTHSNISLKCTSIKSFDEIELKSYQDSQVIVVEEAQFFAGLYDFCKKACDIDDKTVIVSGLDGDSNREKFGEILDLIPICDSVKKLHALCTQCNDGTKASFTKRCSNVENKEQIFIGVKEFSAVCRKHYLE